MDLKLLLQMTIKMTSLQVGSGYGATLEGNITTLTLLTMTFNMTWSKYKKEQCLH
jgi:hypothetical protein